MTGEIKHSQIDRVDRWDIQCELRWWWFPRRDRTGGLLDFLYGLHNDSRIFIYRGTIRIDSFSFRYTIQTVAIIFMIRVSGI